MQLVKINPGYLTYPIPKFDYGDCVLAGGSLRDAIRGQAYSDLDIFGPSEERLLEFAARNNLEAQGYTLVYTSQFAHTYARAGESASIQLVFGRPMLAGKDIDRETVWAQLLSEFPFTINQFLYNGEIVVATPEALLDTFLGLIRVNTLEKSDIFDTSKRVTRYESKGFKQVPGVRQLITKVITSLTPDEFARYSAPKIGRGRGGY